LSNTRKLRVSVTYDHIDRGKRMQAGCCPVALALCELLNVPNDPDLRVTVTQDTLGFFHFTDDDGVLISAPTDVRFFVADFDSNGSVSPFIFEIEVPEAIGG
jgi:hypothetical protein